MKKLTGLLMIGAVAAAVALAPSQASAATCVNKGAEGTNTTPDGARFQAWEAILQATDWGMWAGWMGSSQKIGTAPGYKVSKVRWKCGKGGIGTQCRVYATLCK